MSHDLILTFRPVWNSVQSYGFKLGVNFNIWFKPQFGNDLYHLVNCLFPLFLNLNFQPSSWQSRLYVFPSLLAFS